jgi:hypothetical protein
MKFLFRTRANGYKLLAVHMMIFSAVSSATAQCPSGSFTNTGGTFNNGQTVCITTSFSTDITLNNGATLVITSSGNYTGNLTSKQGSAVQVQTGGKLAPGSLDLAGSLSNAGTVTTNAVTISNGASITNSGTFIWQNGWNQNTSIAITNTACGGMVFSTSVNVGNNASFVNSGLLNFASGLNFNSGSIDNAGFLNVGGDLTSGGLIYNRYKAVFRGNNNNINSGDSIVNLGYMTFANNVSSSPGMRNEGLFTVNGNFNINGSTFLVNNANAQLRVNGTFTNGGTVNGNGTLYAASTLTNNNTLAGFSAAQRLTINKASGAVGGTKTNVAYNTAMVGLDTATYVAAQATSSSCSVLAQQLSSLQALYKTGQVQLNWNAYTATHVQYFIVEYSEDGVHFSKAGQVNADNTGATTLYQYTHYTSLTGTLYYRIRETDINGVTYYSNLVVVKAGSDIITEVFPNPFTNTLQINLQLQKAATIQVQLFDAGGRMLRKIEKQALAGANSIVLSDLQTLLPGVYMTRITAGDKTIFEKLVK